MPDHYTYPGSEVLVNQPGVTDRARWKEAETAVVGFITAEADRVFTALAQANHLQGLDRDAFAQGLATAWGDITAVHPFRDVNTRSQFVFFNQLTAEAGWMIDWAAVDPYLFAHARTVAIYRDAAGLDALIYPDT